MLAEIKAAARRRVSGSDICDEENFPERKLSNSVANVFCCGSSAYGRCGQGQEKQCNVFLPVKLGEGDEEVVFDKVAVGAAHACATSKGDLFSWGKCHVGQLGHGYESHDEHFPRKISSLDHRVHGVGSGTSHCIAWSDTDAYVWGMNYFSCLGKDTKDKHVLKPTKLDMAVLKNAEGGDFHSVWHCKDETVWVSGGKDLNKNGDMFFGSVTSFLSFSRRVSM